jgi:hypothetical protein
MQLGYTKYCCFICEWDSRARDKHYSVKHWKKRQKLTPGERNVVHDPLVDAVKVFLLPLNIKLGLVKNVVEAMKKDGPVFFLSAAEIPSLERGKDKRRDFCWPTNKETYKR